MVHIILILAHQSSSVFISWIQAEPPWLPGGCAAVSALSLGWESSEFHDTACRYRYLGTSTKKFSNFLKVFKIFQDISRYPGLRDAMPAKGKPEATPATVKQGLICLQHITIITILLFTTYHNHHNPSIDFNWCQLMSIDFNWFQLISIVHRHSGLWQRLRYPEKPHKKLVTKCYKHCTIVDVPPLWQCTTT